MALDVEHLHTSQTQRPDKVVRFTARAGLLPKSPVKASTAESTRAFIEALFDAILTPEVRAAAEAFVSGLLKDPERIREGLEALIEEERAGMLGDLYRESKVWFKKLSEVDSKRSRFQDMAAEGLITFDELRSKLAEAEQTRERAQAELEVLDMLRENIEELERDKDAVMKAYAGMVPEELDDLAPEERHQIYKMLRLQVTVDPEMPPEVSGTFGGDLDFCELESSSPRRWTPIRTCCRPCRKRRLALSKTPCPSGLQYGCSSEAWQRCRASSISPNLQEL